MMPDTDLYELNKLIEEAREAYEQDALEFEILADKECPKCVADIGSHRNCVMR